MDRITTTIERQFLAEIVAGRKKVEYRAMKPYWRDRLAKVTTPFVLRLINGMQKAAPEVTVLVVRLRSNRRAREYELHLGKVLRVKNWNRRTEQPARPSDA